MSKASYFQFPLSALYGKQKPSDVTPSTKKRTFDRLIDHCIRSNSERLVLNGGVNEPPDAELDNNLVCSTRIDSILAGMEPKARRKWDKAISDDYTTLIFGDLLASELLGIEITPKSKRLIIKETYGKTLVRIRSDIFSDARAGKLSHQQFAVLCAVHGRIGSNDLRAISYESLRFSASGFSSEGEFQASDLEESLLLTYNQVRTAVGTLVGRRLFFTARYKRKLYYSKTDRNISDRVAQHVAAQEVKRINRICPVVTPQMVEEKIALIVH